MVVQRKNKDDFDVAIGMSYGVVSFLSWYEYIRNSDMGITKIRGAPTTIRPFKGEHLE